MRRQRIVVAGAGVAGSILARALQGRDDVEVICLERATPGDHGDAGTGLNLGPNAVKALRAHLPDLAALLEESSLPWRRWTVDLTDGRRLMDLDLLEVADNVGVRIRWSALYGLLREAPGQRISYGSELVDLSDDGRTATVRDRRTDEVSRIADIDLLVACDGRYSRIRERLLGSEPPRFLGVALYRLLFPVGADCPIDDYGQWFNGPNRLLAFRVPGDLVYCAGSFPIPRDAEVPAAMKAEEPLRQAYTPATGPASPEAAFLIDAIARNAEDLHWARLQEGSVRFAVPDLPVLLLGDAAHPMVPTLGQGATQSVEDACVAAQVITRALAAGSSLEPVPGQVEALRLERVRFAADFSREATDTMLEGADPVAGTLKKRGTEFQARLARLYRDAPLPAEAAGRR